MIGEIRYELTLLLIGSQGKIPQEAASSDHCGHYSGGRFSSEPDHKEPSKRTVENV